jgi:cell wall-associated NlpC family hydrolase
MVDALSIFFLTLVVAASPAVRPVVLESPAPAVADTVAVAEFMLRTPGGGDASELIAFAQALKGTPYKYACSDPRRGFDCSGFVMYVYNHFQITVPRSSIAFTNIGEEIELQQALPGDLILFTGTDSSIRKVGHVGIITQAGDSPSFIHASSGKAHSVTETVLSPHYRKRFIKVVRLLK